MKTTKKEQLEQERNKAKEFLRELFPVGSTAHTVLRHRSSSGMYRAISVVACKDGEMMDVSYWCARAMTSYDKIDQKHGGLKASGCGMDMGFAVVSNLSYALYPNGFECIGDKCPSNDHSNGDRNYEPHHHNSGDYAIKHRWL